MRRPLIAITTSYNSEGMIRMRPAYLDALWQAGAVPVFVAHTTDAQKLDEYAAEFDGFLFSGGVDVDPKYYGEQIMFDSVNVSAERDEFELALAARVIAGERPVLGICRGIQLLNVAMGGDLYQHIEAHSQSEPRDVTPYTVRIQPGTRLHDIVGHDEIRVNSFHHQAVRRVAPGLVCAGVAEDGICEAVCLPGERFLVGVQWHPELFYSKDAAAASIFRAFVEAAKK